MILENLTGEPGDLSGPGLRYTKCNCVILGQKPFIPVPRVRYFTSDTRKGLNEETPE